MTDAFGAEAGPAREILHFIRSGEFHSWSKSHNDWSTEQVSAVVDASPAWLMVKQNTAGGQQPQTN